MIQSDPQTADRAAIAELNARFAWLIDHENGHGVPELFTADGRYGYEGHWCEGRTQIEDFYARRRQRGTRTSRHVFTNSWVVFESDGLALGRSILTLFATDDDPLASACPVCILDYSDTLLRQADGRWRYRERHVLPVFGHMPRLMERETPADARSVDRAARSGSVEQVAEAL
ncbi:hypothetical protein FHR22_002126 [Sphingopyxis panaciterrae]|uniref:nuclear transport factor 2 family protein n=1 Tax=Sphingopyxis panaciterrae TaxID=363841 RepID=UPI00141E59A2|nr:nuclear transport factor 2 family protein [Sphingopyxis panaciterrae]NIJ37442.1 hypothetical protein [Sphingopyxis panaciterrae]